MTTYAIGDIQGCYEPLRRLLDKLCFDPANDTLWVAGDMVNRGPDSLATLRFLKSLGSSCVAVLGNHDLHLLAVDAGIRRQRKKDTFTDILAAPDKAELLHWLKHRALLHHDRQRDITMVHAGIPPVWTLQQACDYAHQLEQALQKDDDNCLLKILFDEQAPSYAHTPWQASTARNDQLRLAAAYLTRMRCCDAQGRLDLKNTAATPAPGYAPWYRFRHSPLYGKTLLFGHWAALRGKTGLANVHALDTGCVWGHCLTAIDLSTFSRIQVDCQP